MDSCRQILCRKGPTIDGRTICLVSIDQAVAQGALSVGGSAVRDLTGQPPASIGDFFTQYWSALVMPVSSLN